MLFSFMIVGCFPLEVGLQLRFYRFLVDFRGSSIVLYVFINTM